MKSAQYKTLLRKKTVTCRKLLSGPVAFQGGNQSDSTWTTSSPFCASCDSLASRAAQRRPSCNSQIPIQRGSGLPQLIAAIPIGRTPGNGGAFAGGQSQLIAAIPIGRAPGNGGAFAGGQPQLIA